MEIFVITPHNLDPFFTRKRQIVDNTAKQFGVNVHYGPNPPYKEETREKVISQYEKFDFFIADLSYERPSCYFEVGFVQALNKPIALIALERTNIHQVFKREEVKFYKDIYEYEVLINSLLIIP